MDCTLEFLGTLPQELRGLKIQPRHRTLLTNMQVGGTMWVVLLTTMPGETCKAWTMGVGDYWRLQPKHGSRNRWIRENVEPAHEGAVWTQASFL